MKHLTFIVPVYGNAGLFLPRCINSLLDNQDYPEKDVIVVYDGEDQMKTALRAKEIFAKDERVQFLTQKHGGAPKARNAGLKLAQGEYVCFFDSDSILKAGALTAWMDSLMEDPTLDFVYSGYRFFMHDGYSDVCPTRPLNKYLLTCNNYISTMNPIKREKCPKWDESLKTLQDWDFWMQVILDNELKGRMLPDLWVVTEAPSEDSLSGYSHQNWSESVDAVRVKHGIKNRDKCFTTFGAEFQTLRRAQFMNADYQDPMQLLSKQYHYDSIISMGYYVDSQVHPYVPFKNCNGAKKIVHFIGTDVWQLQRKPFYQVEYFANSFPKTVDKIFANAPWLVEELTRMGIESELLYCPIDSSPYLKKPFPEQFTLAVYRSDSNPMHNEVLMVDIARSCPDIEWKFFGGTKPNVVGMPKNIEYMGTIPESDMPEFIASTSAIVRVTEHDGFPATLAEWALSNRPYICNLERFPSAKYVDAHVTEANYIVCKERVIKSIRELQREMKNYGYQFLDSNRTHFSDLLSPKTYIDRMNQVCAK